jgi:hypothetical protein
MMNVYDLGKNREILLATGATLRRVFPSVAVRSRADGSHILFAFPRERSAESIRAQLQNAHTDERVLELARQAAPDIRELVPPAGTPVFTDDHAPVDDLTRRMLAERAR